MNFLQRSADLIFLLSGAIVLIAPLARELDPTNLINGNFNLEQFLAFELHAALLAYWARRAATHNAFANAAGALILGLASVASGIWMVHFMGTDAMVFLAPTLSVIGFGCATMLLVLMAGLGAAGRPLILIVFGFVTFGYLGQFVPQLMSNPRTQFTSYVAYLVYSSDGLFGLALDIIANIVLAFVIFGAAFEVSGGGRVIVNIAMRLALNSRSSPIKACVVASGLFGTISGAAISNVLTSGAFSIPSMRKIGVRKETAAGIEAAASTCGQVMPPVLGAAAFFLANLAGVSYTTVVIASFGPALACYYAFFRQADLVVLDGPVTAMAVAPEPFERSWLLFILPPAAIVYFLLKSSDFISVAAIAGTAMCFLVSVLFQGWQLSVNRFRERIASLITSSVHLLVIAAAIGLLLGALYSTGLTVAGAMLLGRLGEYSFAIALIVAAVAAFILGMGVATVSVYVIAAALLTPGLIDSGIPPLAAHFFVLYCAQTSMITPPVALASLAASTLAEADFWATSQEAMRFGWMLFVVPFIIVLRPGILLLGPWHEILLSFVLTFVFITVVTSKHLGTWIRRALTLLLILAILWKGSQWIAVAASVATLPFLLHRYTRAFGLK